MKRILAFIAVNGLYAYFMYLAFGGSMGAQRVLVFFTWLFFANMACLTTMDSLASHRATLRAKGRALPAWLSHCIGLAFILTFAWNAWWWTAIAYAVNESFEAEIYREPKP